MLGNIKRFLSGQVVSFLFRTALFVALAAAGVSPATGPMDPARMAEWFLTSTTALTFGHWLLLAAAVIVVLSGPLVRGAASLFPVVLLFSGRDFRSLFFRCERHTQMYRIQQFADRGERPILLSVEVRRRIKNTTLLPLKFAIGLEFDIYAGATPGPMVAYRKNQRDWEMADATNTSVLPATWRIEPRDIWVWPQQTVEVESIWHEWHQFSDAYVDNFAVPTCDPMVIVGADPGLDVKVAYAGHPEKRGSPGGAFPLDGMLESDQQIRFRWWPRGGANGRDDVQEETRDLSGVLPSLTVHQKP